MFFPFTHFRGKAPAKSCHSSNPSKSTTQKLQFPQDIFYRFMVSAFSSLPHTMLVKIRIGRSTLEPPPGCFFPQPDMLVTVSCGIERNSSHCPHFLKKPRSVTFTPFFPPAKTLVGRTRVNKKHEICKLRAYKDRSNG